MWLRLQLQTLKFLPASGSGSTPLAGSLIYLKYSTSMGVDNKNNDKNDNDAEEFIPVEDDKNDEEVAATIDHKGDNEAFEERKNIDKKKMMVEPQVIKLQILSKVIRSVILLTVYRADLALGTQPTKFLIEDDVKISLLTDLELLLPNKLKVKVLNTFSQKNYANGSQETNRKIRKLHRTPSISSKYHNFSMDEFRAALAIILRAGSNRDNFTELKNLWKVGDSKPFYRAVMSFNRFKCFLRSIRFHNWHTREQ